MSGLDHQLIAQNIARARARKAAALTEYEEASAELTWWLQGARLAGLAVVREADEEPDREHLEELFPPASFFHETATKPTLRQAIMALLREHPDAVVTSSELAQALIAEGWLDRKEAQKRVSDVAVLMRRDKQLEHVGRGQHRLHPRMAIAFDQARSTSSSAEKPD